MKKLFTYMLAMALLAIQAHAQSAAYTQARVYPIQQEECGAAQLSQDGDAYVLGNNVLAARFLSQDGKLTFGGCEAMCLKAGTELFTLSLNSGATTLKASEMKVASITMEDLEANDHAVKGAEHFAGKALCATLTGRVGTTTVTAQWKAELRDGSHYIRTDLTLSGSANLSFYNIVPLIYDVNVAKAGSMPAVVGNTRGAIVASEKIFAGLETPTGINSVVGQSVDLPTKFSYDSWTASDFTWTPAAEVPAKILALGYSASDIVGKRGYVSFKQAGSQTITFQYSSGTHRLNIVGVDVLDLEGNVVTSDYHVGYTGGANQNNAYTVSLPSAGSYQVRYFVEVKTETITSAGKIAYSGSVVAPTVIYDLLSSSPSQFQTASSPKLKILSGNSIDVGGSLADSWTPAQWVIKESVPARINELGYYNPNVLSIEQPLSVVSDGRLTVEFLYASGSNRLNLLGVDLVDDAGDVVAYDYHFGYTGGAKADNVYTLDVPYGGNFTLRYFATDRDEVINSTGSINVQFTKEEILHLPGSAEATIQGLWSRNTTLARGKTWNVSAVVGLVAPGQARRSVLAYSERERAVPWRAMPVYISWYELNINRNNDANYTTNMNINQCVDVVKQWKTRLFDKYGVGVGSFVWDDGWDQYGTWTFSPNFPNGFTEVDEVARQMCSGIGAWLGPVGGYGTSGNYRRAYWQDKGGMQLSNSAYYKVFTDACENLIKSYDFRFFKFDGISAQFSSVGPDAGTTGEENAEAIISAERYVRENLKEDIFFNTTVGTWASPFWFHVSDAVWRQENDYGTIGNNTIDRENWITYRDRLVYQNFVQNSPLCPINTLMTHGFILSKYGNVSSNITYAAVLREMRCAFACGSGMVELYNDYSLMNSIQSGRLWRDLSECIQWQRKNADVLPDIHWVGGNPWDGSKANVYGWAGWNGRKAVFTVRNGANSSQTFKTTLRQALDIPADVHTTITLSKGFGVQAALPGITLGEPIDIDEELTLTLAASSVYVFDGVDNSEPLQLVSSIAFDEPSVEVAVGEAVRLGYLVYPLDASDKRVEWSSSDETVATVTDGTVTGVADGVATITAKTVDGSEVIGTFVVRVGDVTGIALQAIDSASVAEIYDLTGRRVSKPAKGVYIINGQKRIR